MIELILILLANSLYIFGLKASMSEGMILELVPVYLDWLPLWVKMPLFECPICMASIHSYIFPILVIAFSLSWWLLLLWVAYVVMLAGLNSILLKVTND
jgi:hypothetical protein